MRCDQVQGLFSEIYDGEAVQADLAEHLQNCPACRLEYERFCRLLDELKQLPEPELPQGFHESIMAKIRELAQQDKPAHTAVERQFVVHRGQRDASRRRQTAKKAASISRRWASVAAAACVLLMSLWAVRVFDLPGARLADSPAYNMAMPEMTDLAPAGTQAAPVAPPDDDHFMVAAEDEAAADEWYTEDLFDEDTPRDANHRMAEPALEAVDDEYFGDEYSMETAPQSAAVPQEARVGDSYGDYDSMVDFSEEAEEEPGTTWAGFDNDISEEDYPEFEAITMYQVAGDYVIPDTAPFAPVAITMQAHDADDMVFALGLTGGEGISPWDIAFAGGIIVLLIALAAMIWDFHKNRAKKG